MSGDNDKNKKGFSGLSDLASDVSGFDESIKPEPNTEAKSSAPKQTTQRKRGTAPSAPKKKTRSSAPPIDRASSVKNSGGSGVKLIFAIIGIVSVIWFISNGSKSNKRPSYQASYPSVSSGSSESSNPKKPIAQYTREAQRLLTDLGYDPGPVDGDYGHRTSSAVKAFQRDAGITQDGWIGKDLLNTLRRVKAHIKHPLSNEPSPPQSNNYQQTNPAPVTPKPSTAQSAGLEYIKPKVGTSNVLSVSEIRWCIRESIRIEAMRDVLDANEVIGEFNKFVNDYNNRCGRYRYRQGSKSIAEKSLAPYRSQIVTEAIREARLRGSSFLDTKR